MADRSQLFDDIDSMEPERFTAHLADDVTMRFGNAEPVQGRAAVHDVWAGFCEGIDGVSHAPASAGSPTSGTVVEADVDLHAQGRRHGHRPGRDDLPRGATIDDYRVFIDLAPLFA